MLFRPDVRSVARTALLASCLLAVPTLVQAGGGYFLLGYGPYSYQSGGTVTAIGFDAFAGATNPAKQWTTGNRVDLGVQFFMPHRSIDRTGSGTPYDFGTTSRNRLFVLPEGGFSRRLDEHFAFGVTLYGNGGLNTEYHGDTGVPGSSANPARCGDRPGNFLFGCGKIGFDVSQLIVAPTVSWHFSPVQTVGIAPLIAYQQFKAYGLQAFEPFSASARHVTNKGYDSAFGGGVRIGWYAKPLSWLSVGASYSTRVYMQDFKTYRGLLADHGNFDIPENYSVGLGLMPTPDWTFGIDIQRINFGDVNALGNAVPNSLQNPASPFGSRNGSGFNWRNQTTYRAAIAYKASERFTLRAGYAYGKQAQRDNSVQSTTFNMFAPNPRANATVGLSYALNAKDELNFAYGRYLQADFQGPSASPVGGTERIEPYVVTVMVGWSHRY